MAIEIPTGVTGVFLTVWFNSGQKMTVEFEHWDDAVAVQQTITAAQAQVWDLVLGEKDHEQPALFMVEPQVFECLSGKMMVQPGFIAGVQITTTEENLRASVNNQRHQDEIKAALQKEMGFGHAT